MPSRKRHATALVAVATALILAAPAAASPDVLVSNGSPTGPFSANKQNEPALAVDPVHTSIMAAGANDNIDMEACNAGADTTCPFTPDVGVSGVYLSTNAGGSWTQPKYSGITARGCTGAVGDSDPGCTPTWGTIGTLPNYAQAGMVSDGDPALAFGPVPGSDGKFSWGNGERLYYVNLTSARTGYKPFTGAEAIAVSHTDNVTQAKTGDNSAWSAPVVASKQNGGRFSDKEQVWADNVSTSKYFGNVYVCYAAFQGNGSGVSGQSLKVITSRDGGSTWSEQQVSSAASNINSTQGFGRTGCAVRTDSHGKVYVFAWQSGYDPAGAAKGQTILVTSTDGGAHWSNPRTVFSTYDLCNYFEPSIGRCVEDGVGGARDDLGPAPSVDIANGAPYGTGATNRIVVAWADGRDGLNNEDVKFTTSADGGQSWAAMRDIQQAGDRGYYAAPAISPNGKDVYVVYNAWTEPFKDSAVGAANDRPLVGVVEHADVTSSGVGAFAVLHRGATGPGEARGSSQNNLAAEFLGDYVYAVATRTFGSAVWNDTRNAADCPAIDAYRQALHDEAVSSGAQTAAAEEPRGETDGDVSADATAADLRPAVQQQCPLTFGNSDIYGGTYADPTP